MFPLVTAEFAGPHGRHGPFDLMRALNHGLLPAHYLSSSPRRSLDAYVRDYLKEEVFDEGLTRNVPAFSRFFEAVGYSHGELVNYANIARDCGVDAKTVKEYFQILCDTLLGRLVPPYKQRQERQVISKAPKWISWRGVGRWRSRSRGRRVSTTAICGRSGCLPTRTGPGWRSSSATNPRSGS
jgi:predicted AAA+ superfamily ATPase